MDRRTDQEREYERLKAKIFLEQFKTVVIALILGLFTVLKWTALMIIPVIQMTALCLSIGMFILSFGNLKIKTSFVRTPKNFYLEGDGGGEE